MCDLTQTVLGEDDGVRIVHAVLASSETAELARTLETSGLARSRAGARHLMGHRAVSSCGRTRRTTTAYAHHRNGAVAVVALPAPDDSRPTTAAAFFGDTQTVCCRSLTSNSSAPNRLRGLHRSGRWCGGHSTARRHASSRLTSIRVVCCIECRLLELDDGLRIAIAQLTKTHLRPSHSCQMTALGVGAVKVSRSPTSACFHECN